MIINKNIDYNKYVDDISYVKENFLTEANMAFFQRFAKLAGRISTLVGKPSADTALNNGVKVGRRVFKTSLEKWIKRQKALFLKRVGPIFNDPKITAGSDDEIKQEKEKFYKQKEKFINDIRNSNFKYIHPSLKDPKNSPENIIGYPEKERKFLDSTFKTILILIIENEKISINNDDEEFISINDIKFSFDEAHKFSEEEQEKIGKEKIEDEQKKDAKEDELKRVPDDDITQIIQKLKDIQEEFDTELKEITEEEIDDFCKNLNISSQLKNLYPKNTYVQNIEGKVVKIFTGGIEKSFFNFSEIDRVIKDLEKIYDDKKINSIQDEEIQKEIKEIRKTFTSYFEYFASYITNKLFSYYFDCLNPQSDKFMYKDEFDIENEDDKKDQAKKKLHIIMYEKEDDITKNGKLQRISFKKNLISVLEDVMERLRKQIASGFNKNNVIKSAKMSLNPSLMVRFDAAFDYKPNNFNFKESKNYFKSINSLKRIKKLFNG